MIDKVRTPAPVLIAYFDAARLDDYLRLAATLRAAGIGVEVYPEPKKLGQQLQYADRRGFRVALIAGEREFAAGTCQVKDLATTQSSEAPLDRSRSAHRRDPQVPGVRGRESIAITIIHHGKSSSQLTPDPLTFAAKRAPHSPPAPQTASAAPASASCTNRACVPR